MKQKSWRYTGQSVIGTSHIKTGISCQDAHRVEIKDDVLIAVVADGAGSAKYADLAAQFVTEQAITLVEKNCNNLLRVSQTPEVSNSDDWERLLKEVVFSLHNSLEKKAKEMACSPRDLATTFLLSIVLHEEIIGIQVGDGAIIYGLENQTNLQMLTFPTCGEYINETTFLVSDNYTEYIQFKYIKGNTNRLALFSDGLQMLVLDMKTELPQPYHLFFQPLFAFLEKVDNVGERQKRLQEFLASPRVCNRTDDDKTLIAAIKGNMG